MLTKFDGTKLTQEFDIESTKKMFDGNISNVDYHMILVNGEQKYVSYNNGKLTIIPTTLMKKRCTVKFKQYESGKSEPFTFISKPTFTFDDGSLSKEMKPNGEGDMITVTVVSNINNTYPI